MTKVISKGFREGSRQGVIEEIISEEEKPIGSVVTTNAEGTLNVVISAVRKNEPHK